MENNRVRLLRRPRNLYARVPMCNYTSSPTSPHMVWCKIGTGASLVIINKVGTLQATIIIICNPAFGRPNPHASSTRYRSAAPSRSKDAPDAIMFYTGHVRGKNSGRKKKKNGYNNQNRFFPSTSPKATNGRRVFKIQRYFEIRDAYTCRPLTFRITAHAKETSNCSFDIFRLLFYYCTLSSRLYTVRELLRSYFSLGIPISVPMVQRSILKGRDSTSAVKPFFFSLLLYTYTTLTRQHECIILSNNTASKTRVGTYARLPTRVTS